MTTNTLRRGRRAPICISDNEHKQEETHEHETDPSLYLYKLQMMMHTNIRKVVSVVQLFAYSFICGRMKLKEEKKRIDLRFAITCVVQIVFESEEIGEKRQLFVCPP